MGNALEFSVTFSSPVSGLTPEDFTVDSSAGDGIVCVPWTHHPHSACGGRNELGRVTGFANVDACKAHCLGLAGCISFEWARGAYGTCTFSSTCTTAFAGIGDHFNQYDLYTLEDTCSLPFVKSPYLVAWRALSGSGSSYTLTLTVHDPVVESLLVSVSLPASAGVVAPVNAGSAAAAVVQYTPPVPTVALAAGQVSPSTGNVLEFSVTFSSPVSGLTAGDLTVDVGDGGVVVARSLTGSGNAYSLTLTLTEPTSTAVAVSVTLSAAAGAVAPTNTATTTAATVVYTPPAPVVSPRPSGVTDVNVLRFDVAFSANVAGLAAEHFTIRANGVAFQRVLTGSADTWELVITVDAGAIGVEEALVPTAVEARLTWAEHSARCTLASTLSADGLDAVAAARGWSSKDYWYTSSLAACPMSLCRVCWHGRADPTRTVLWRV